jgi:hypothetical protein
MTKTMNSIFSIRENQAKNRRLGSVLAVAVILYIAAIIAFIIAY